MEKLVSTNTVSDLCQHFFDDKDFFDVSLKVAGSELSVSTHAMMLSLLPGQLGYLLEESGADLVLFPEGSEQELQVLVDFVYKGIKGYVSDGIAQALDMKNDEDDYKAVKLERDGEVKLEALEEEDLLPALLDYTSGNDNKHEIKHFVKKEKTGKKMKKKKGLMKKQKTEHEDEKGGSGWVAGMSPQKQEHRRMSALLATEPERFRLYNRLVYSGIVKDKKDGETDNEFMVRMQNYNKFPGLIYNDECTRFIVCIECGTVTKNVPVTHNCSRKVDYLINKPIEMIKRLNKSKHLNKYFKQKADKVQCVQCSLILPDIDEFKVHLKNIHDIEPLLFRCNNQYGDFICQDCGLRLVTKALLKRHEVVKHGKIELANFSCTECSQYFITKNTLETHIKMMHEDYRPHVCEVCARSFKIKRHLLSHKLTHTGERSFECRHCDKRFAKEWTRKQHERLHLGVKPYVCHVCDAKYSQKTSLDCHVRTHHSSKHGF